MMKRGLAMGVMWAAMLGSPAAAAECPDAVTTGIWAARYPHDTVRLPQAPLTLKEAYCAQRTYVEALQRRFGPPVGYKVGFTGPAGQLQFQIDQPAFGVLLADMFVEDGATVPADYGHRPLLEPDLLVVVADEAINRATTIEEVAAYLASVHPLIELPAIPFTADAVVTGTGLVALNIGATRLVMGPGVPMQTDPVFLQALADAQTLLIDENGRQVQAAPTATLMGHPLRVVLWLVAELRREGLQLHEGDRISLGAVGGLFPLVQQGKAFTYRLDGLPSGPVSVSVRFGPPSAAESTDDSE